MCLEIWSTQIQVDVSAKHGVISIRLLVSICLIPETTCESRAFNATTSTMDCSTCKRPLPASPPWAQGSLFIQFCHNVLLAGRPAVLLRLMQRHAPVVIPSHLDVHDTSLRFCTCEQRGQYSTSLPAFDPSLFFPTPFVAVYCGFMMLSVPLSIFLQFLFLCSYSHLKNPSGYFFRISNYSFPCVISTTSTSLASLCAVYQS